MAGFDPHWFLTCDDPIAVRTAQLVAERRVALDELRDNNLAVRISNAVWKGVGG